jgi:energy-coupling factor transport system permease protein
VTAAVRTRRIHAGAWWLWALALGATATRTTNPLLLVLIAAVAGYVTVACRPAAPWSKSYGTFLRLAAVVLLIRVAFHVFLGGVTGPTELFHLPEVPLPGWAAGIRLGGAVSLEGLLHALYDGLRLGVLLICVGAANSLADPRRLLQSLPGALYEVSVAVVVALTTAPQLVVSAGRIRRARQLRGHNVHGLRRVTSLLVPVIEDAVDRSLSMAATMDSRGYGRVGVQPRRVRVLTGVCVLGGLGGLAMGAYGALDASAPDALGLPLVLAGGALGGLGLALGSRRVVRTRYRPDHWGLAETLIAGSGIAALVGVLVAEQTGAGDLIPAFTPVTVPVIPPSAAIGVVVALLPIFVARTPVPARPLPMAREVTT